MLGTGCADQNVSVLDLHHDRRTAGVPTVSVLRGVVPAGAGRFRIWATSRGLRLSTFAASGGRDLVARCLGALGCHPALREAAITTVALAAETTNDSVRGLADSHSRDAATLFDRAAAAGPREAMACAVLGRPVPTPRDGARFLVDMLPVSSDAPALLAIVDGATPEGDAALKEVARLAVSAPSLSIGVAVPASVYSALMRGGDARWKALLREGLIDVFPEEPPPAPIELSGAHVRVRDELIAGGSSEVLRAFDHAAILPKHAPASVARSACEDLLFRVLEQRAETAGFFELNGKLDFKFGTRAAEVDVVSRRLGIAVEIDGYFHFAGGEEAYRRDRRKDRLLQEHGYHVIRYLAGDIVANLSQITKEICDTVRARKQEKKA